MTAYARYVNRLLVKAPGSIGIQTMARSTKNTQSKATGSEQLPAAPSPVVHETFSDLRSKLDFTERLFVRECLKDGDTKRAAHTAGHRTPYDLLGRITVRQCLLSAIPFTDSNVTARLIRPYVIERLVNDALSGNVTASKALLELKVERTQSASYTRRANGTGSKRTRLVNSTDSDDTNSPGTDSPSTDSELHGE